MINYCNFCFLCVGFCYFSTRLKCQMTWPVRCRLQRWHHPPASLRRGQTSCLTAAWSQVSANTWQTHKSTGDGYKENWHPAKSFWLWIKFGNTDSVKYIFPPIKYCMTFFLRLSVSIMYFNNLSGIRKLFVCGSACVKWAPSRVALVMMGVCESPIFPHVRFPALAVKSLPSGTILELRDGDSHGERKR